MANEPWKPATCEDADVAAFKALAAGVANEGQQKRALQWLIHKVARTYDLSYRPGPDGERDTAFAEGMRSVGLQVVKLINLPAKAAGQEAIDGTRRVQRTRRKAG